MKLHELKNIRSSKGSQTIEVEPAGGMYGTFKVEVTFNYFPPSSTLHVHGDPTTREHHPAEFEVDSIVLAEPVTQHGEDGETVIHIWPIGTNVSHLPGWDASDEKYVQDHLTDEVEPYEPDYSSRGRLHDDY